MQEGLSRSLLSFLGVFDCSWAVYVQLPPTAAPQPLRAARPKGRPRGWGLRGEDLDIIDVYEELDKGILV